MHGVLETRSYLSSADRVGLSDDERGEIVAIIAANPTVGDLMAGTGGARKFRYAVKGKGKSAGVRVITYFAGDDLPVFLLDVFGKNEKDNLTKAERNELRKALSSLADAYRKERK